VHSTRGYYCPHASRDRANSSTKETRKSSVTVDSSYTFSARKDCDPKVNSEEFGVYVGGSALSIPIPLVNFDDKVPAFGN